MAVFQAAINDLVARGPEANHFLTEMFNSPGGGLFLPTSNKLDKLLLFEGKIETKAL